jgi:hypothetical protein
MRFRGRATLFRGVYLFVPDNDDYVTCTYFKWHGFDEHTCLIGHCALACGGAWHMTSARDTVRMMQQVGSAVTVAALTRPSKAPLLLSSRHRPRLCCHARHPCHPAHAVPRHCRTPPMLHLLPEPVPPRNSYEPVHCNFYGIGSLTVLPCSPHTPSRQGLNYFCTIPPVTQLTPSWRLRWHHGRWIRQAGMNSRMCGKSSASSPGSTEA